MVHGVQFAHWLELHVVLSTTCSRLQRRRLACHHLFLQCTAYACSTVCEDELQRLGVLTDARMACSGRVVLASACLTPIWLFLWPDVQALAAFACLADVLLTKVSCIMSPATVHCSQIS
jgi:hypothetical protein